MASNTTTLPSTAATCALPFAGAVAAVAAPAAADALTSARPMTDVITGSPPRGPAPA